MMGRSQRNAFIVLFPLGVYLLFRISQLFPASVPVVQVGLAFGVLFIVPGWLLAVLVMPGRRFRVHELIPLSFSLSVLLVVGSLVVCTLLGAGVQASYAAIVWALLPFVVMTSFLIRRRGRVGKAGARGAGSPASGQGVAEGVFLALVVAAAAVSFLLKDPGFIGSESWVHMKVVNAVLLADTPFPDRALVPAAHEAGAGPAGAHLPDPSAAYLITAVLSLASGVHPVTIFLNSPGIYVPILMLSFFAFSTACFRKARAATFAALLMSAWLPGFFEQAAWPQYSAAVLLYTALWLLVEYMENRQTSVLVLCALIGAFSGIFHPTCFLRWYFTLGAFLVAGFLLLTDRKRLAALLAAALLTLVLALPYLSLQPGVPEGSIPGTSPAPAAVSPEVTGLKWHLSLVDLAKRDWPLGPGGRSGSKGLDVLLSPGYLVPMALALILLLRRRKGAVEVLLVGVVLGPAAVFLATKALGSFGEVAEQSDPFQLWQPDLIYPLLCCYAVFVLPASLRSGWMRRGAAVLAVLAVVVFAAPTLMGNAKGCLESQERKLFPRPYDWRDGYAFLDSISAPSLILTDEWTDDAMSAFTKHRALSFGLQPSGAQGSPAARLSEASPEALALFDAAVGIDRTIALLSKNGVGYVVLNSEYFGGDVPPDVLRKLEGSPDLFARVYDSGGWLVYRVAATKQTLLARAQALYASAWKAYQAGDWERMAEEFHSILLLDPLNLGGEVRLGAETKVAVLFATVNPASDVAERAVYLLGDTYVSNMLECRQILDPTTAPREVERLLGELGIQQVAIVNRSLPSGAFAPSWPITNLALNALRFELEYSSDALTVYHVLKEDRERALTHIVAGLTALARDDPLTAQVEAAKARVLSSGDPAVLEGANEIARGVRLDAREAVLRGEEALRAIRGTEALEQFQEALHLGERGGEVLQGFFRALDAAKGADHLVLASPRCEGDRCGPAMDGEVVGSGAWADLGNEGLGFVDIDLQRRGFIKDVWVTVYLHSGDASDKRMRTLSLYTSLDGAWWALAKSVSGWPMDVEGVYTFLLEDLYLYGRYLRLVVEGDKGVPLRVDEVEVWSYGPLADVVRDGMWADVRGPSLRLGRIEATYEAEGLHRLVGVEERDPSASSGAAVALPAMGDKGYILYGPYDRFPPGRYRVLFRLRAEDPAPFAPVAVLDVTSDRARTVHRRVELFGEDFLGERSYREFALDFRLPQPSELELRVFASGGALLRVDLVRVEAALDECVVVEGSHALRISAGWPRAPGVISYEAEAYAEGVGRPRHDEDAFGEAALHGSALRDAAGMLLIQRSEPLEAGLYEAAFRVKVLRRTVSGELAVLSVVGADGHTALVRRPLYGQDFEGRLTYQYFPLRFAAQQGERVEYRVIFSDMVDVWVDDILVRRLSEVEGGP